MSSQWCDIDTSQWEDVNNQWGFASGTTLSGLQNIWTDENYVYAATASGLDVIDIETEQRTSFATYTAGYSCVWANDTHVFLGTTEAGVKRLSKAAIGPEEISFSIYSYLSVPDIFSDTITYIHGNSERILIASDEGVNVVQESTGFMYGYFNGNGVTKCFVTPDVNVFYYVVAGNQVHRKSDPAGNWISSDVIYSSGVGFLAGVSQIKDIFVTNNTSLSGEDNTLFLATDDGVLIFDEDSGYAVKYTI